MHPQLEPFVPTRAEPWDFDAAAHLWRRAGFGAPPPVVRETLKLGPAEAAARVVAGPASDPAVRDLETIRESVLGSEDAARAWLIARMVRSAHPLREKLALFWHGHFATSIRKVRKLDWMMRQYGLFLRHGLGRFGLLLEKVTRDPAMIRWLDNETNAKGRANENYARELFELFTLGVGNYTEQDVKQSARAFTGWHILHDRFHFSKSLHDDGEKTLLGQTGRFDGDDVVRIALEQKACARFLSRKLLVFFLHPDPPPDLVEGLAAVMRERDYDMSATLRVLFGSRAFFAPANRRALIKSPIDFGVGAARALEIPVDAQAAVPALREMGQELLAPPNVKGWPGGRDWINTASWLARIDAARGLAAAKKPTLGGAEAVKIHGTALLGRPPAAGEAESILKEGTGKRDLVHALLALPEAHLA